MKKKTIIIATIILVVLIAGLIIGIINYSQYTRLFKDTDYPVSYKSKNGNIILTVKDKSDSDVIWTATVDDPDYAEVTIKGNASAKKMKCIISPKEEGLTIVSFTKTLDAAGLSVDKTRIEFPIYISESNEGMKIEFIDNGTLIEGNDVIGSGTDHPVILCGNADIAKTEEDLGILGNIDFINGRDDWTVETDSKNIIITTIDNSYESSDENSEKASTETDASSADNRCYMYLSYSDNSELIPDNENASQTDSDEAPEGTIIDPSKNSVTDAVPEETTATDAENESVTEKGSGVITISSSKLGVSIKKKVTFYSDGHIVFGSPDNSK